MTESTAEFARPVPLARLGSEPFRQWITASAEERSVLARRFDLVSLDRLAAEIELRREPGGTILLSARFEAEFAQQCGVTLAPVPGQLDERFELRYGPPECEDQAPAGDDDPAFEPLFGEAIDIGEAVAQEFSLALPPFPRALGVVVDSGPAEPLADGPFAALAKLRRDGPR